jgi:hypothetical protein
MVTLINDLLNAGRCRRWQRGALGALWLLGLPGLSGLGCAPQPSPKVVSVPQPVRAARPPAAPPPPPSTSAEPNAPRPDPESRRFFLARIAEPSVGPGVAPPSRVTALALENTARGEAASMKPDADMITAILDEGQRLTVPVSIAAGACATFIAHGGLGVIEVDLFLTQGKGADVTILAQDPETGPIAVIGGSDGCFKGPKGEALSADLSVVARRGKGPVVARVFRR